MTPEQVEALLDANAAAIGLPIAPAHRPGVVRYLALAAAMAAELDAPLDPPLDLRDESAPQFVPIAPITPSAPR